MNNKKKNKGFTLIELIIVIAIIAILAAIAVPSFIGIQAEAVKAKDIGNATAMCTAINVYNSLNPDSKITSATASSAYATTCGDLWPEGLSAEDEASALTRVVVDANGIATVNKGDVSSSASESAST